MIERSIDRVLLGYSNESLKNIKKLVKRLEICKETSSYRIEFWQKDGKKEHEVTKLQTKEKSQMFRNKNETALQKLGAILYSIVVISASPNNVLCHTLFPFQFHRPVSLSEQTAQSIFSQMYCNDWASFVAQKDINKKPFVQLYTSKRVGMGKSYKIRKVCEKASQHVCIAFNSEDIEWKYLVHNFWRYHPSQADLTIAQNRKIRNHDIIAFDLDLSSSISTEINNFLFELLFLQHVNIGQNILECFHVNHNMAFFVEIPSKLSNDKQTTQQLLYTLFGPIAFPILDVNTENNPYDYGKEVQYALKWIREFNTNYLLEFREKKKIHFYF
ncbi:hypothetical protein RFI_25331 [Reticulomyxa filosa]|uniref:Uncharacterized protein n=1 Tax=Reticulomyxa filosa TaxID=46433 RepID=X6MG65_RETFI|nr:hypothetical protein RFI_25331 [Reticulomyxa filosa]|eukprot:ETO12045.1 hypothetical protein RFI_25331 [Reticulomyxa filosa]